MSKILISLSIFGMVLAMAYAFGTPARAADSDQMNVSRDFGSFTMSDVNQFGDDRAYSSATGGSDRDADIQLFKWTPDTYGLRGSYGYFNGSGGSGS